MFNYFHIIYQMKGEKNMTYQKRMPADWVKKIEEGLTFLNDKKINGELYAYLMSQSYGKDGKTIVEKKKLPKQTEICEIIGIKSRTTYNTHLNYLIEKGYIEEEKKGIYTLLNPESMYFEIPQDTLNYLNDTASEQVIKAFICLGQMWSFSQNKKELYTFTKKELCERIGMPMKGGNANVNYDKINNILCCLIKCGFIDVEVYHDDKMLPHIRLLNFSKKCPTESYDFLKKNSEYDKKEMKLIHNN